MYDPSLIVLTEKENKSPNLIKMMRNFKVPIGLSPDEKEAAKAYFLAKQKNEKKWYQFWKRQKDLSLFD